MTPGREEARELAMLNTCGLWKNSKPRVIHPTTPHLTIGPI